MKRPSLIALLLALGVVWGLTIPLTKIVVSTGHHPFGLLFWQSVIAAVILLVIMVYRRSKLVLDKSHLAFFAFIAFSGTIIPNSVSYWAISHLPAGVMALIIALVPMFAFLVALMAKLEKFQLQRFVGIMLGALAIALIVLPESSLPDPSKIIFILIALISPLCYGIETNYLSVKQPAGTGPFATLFGASLIGILVMTPLVFATGTFINPLDGMGVPEWSLVASTFLHVVAYSGFIYMVSKAGPVFSSQIAYIVTPAGVMLSVWILNESHSTYIWLALIILLVALALVRPMKENPNPIQTNN